MYFILTIGFKDGVVIRQRCIGYYKHFNTAHRRVLDNACDMFEDGYYNYAVVAKLEQGIYPQLNITKYQWYYYDNKEQSIITITKPKNLDENELYFIG